MILPNDEIRSATDEAVSLKIFDTIDQTSIDTIEAAIKQATEAGRQVLVQNLTEILRLVKLFPGQSLVRINDLSQLDVGVDVRTQDMVLHMREPHSFTYNDGQGQKVHDTRSIGGDPLPIYSMRHGILLVHPNTKIVGTVTDFRENLFNCDLPSALSSVDLIPAEGLRISTHHYRMEPTKQNTHNLWYTRVNPKAKVTPLEFMSMSLNPKNRF